MKRKVVRAILLSFASTVLIGSGVSAITISNSYAEILNAVLSGKQADLTEVEAVQEATKNVGKAIEQEGSVLVRNKNHALPLSSSVKRVNVFGRASTDWIYSGSGSGQVQPENGNSSMNVDLLKALASYGIETNNALSDFYLSYQQPLGYGDALGQNAENFYVLSEPSLSEYSSSLLSGAKDFSTTALFVISRRAGESEDPTKHQNKLNGKSADYSRTYLEISAEEEEMLSYLGENYEKVIVIINSTNVIELSFLETIPNLDACLIVGPTGTKFASEIPLLLYGDVCPSGKLADTYAYELESALTYRLSGLDGISYYTNSSGYYPTGYDINSGISPQPGVPYFEYLESIYSGYRFYETADEEGAFDTIHNQYGDGYEGVVQFPFGYGLSYTEFAYELFDIKNGSGTSLDDGSSIGPNDELTFTIEVTNIGDRSGKDVVELYAKTPYVNGQIEKSSVVLADFAKTSVLGPGKSQTVEVKASMQDLASYDCYDKNLNGFSGYELDAGEYGFFLGESVHKARQISVNDVLKNAEFQFSLPNGETFPTAKSTGNPVKNLFTGATAVDGLPLDGSATGTNQNNYVSRSNFPAQLTKDESARAMTTAQLETNLYCGPATHRSGGSNLNNPDWSKAEQWNNASIDDFGNPVSIPSSSLAFGASGSLSVSKGGTPTKLGFELGKNYDDSRWDELLNQITIDEAVSMISQGIYHNVAVPSIGKPLLNELDGPIQAKGFSSAPRGPGYPSTCVLACTWNKQLCHEFGLAFARNLTAVGLQGVYGPGANLHRSPFEGRNYEYYSECPILTGKLVSMTCLGLKEGGKYGYVKHFGLGEIESERDGCYTFMSEQTLREIYMKPFQIMVESGSASGFMTSYSRVGSVWAGGSAALITGLLKNEWGFHGGIITDWSDHNEYMLMDQALRAGGNIGMSCKLYATYNSSSSPRVKARLKEAVKEVTYMWLSVSYANQQYNERASDAEKIDVGTIEETWIWWPSLVADTSIALFFGATLCLYFAIRPFLPFVKEEQK